MSHPIKRKSFTSNNLQAHKQAVKALLGIHVENPIIPVRCRLPGISLLRPVPVCFKIPGEPVMIVLQVIAPKVICRNI